MTTLQLVHYWVSFAALMIGMGSAVLIIIGMCLPKVSTFGDACVKVGAVALVLIVAVYLAYCGTAVTYAVVMRS